MEMERITAGTNNISSCTVTQLQFDVNVSQVTVITLSKLIRLCKQLSNKANKMKERIFDVNE